ncbi:MAG TPA: AMP-binding protein, partial [Thermoanaerobaculia bacterium]|nr:AMP-binding protein [Thermoanaerobaculia bacterium]
MTSTNSFLGFRLSPRQRRAWQWERMSRGPASQSTVRLEGRVDRERLRDALRQVVRRHQILRTVFPRAAGMKYPLQVVREESEPHWRELDLTGGETGEHGPRLVELCQLESFQSFDLEQGPVLRVALVNVSPVLHFLVVSLPILCADQRTLDLLTAEIAGAYSSSLEREEVLQYLQFSEWQNELAGDAEGAPVGGESQSGPQDLRFPHELASAGQNIWAPGRLRVPLEDGVVTRMADVARDHGVALHEVLLSCWQVLISKLTGCSGPVLGVLFDGRTHAELAGIFGLLARWLPVAGRCEPELEFRELMARTHHALSLAAQSQDQMTCYDFAEGSGEPPRFAAGFEAYDPLPRHQAGSLSFMVVERRMSLERPKVSLSWVPAEGAATLELLYDPAWLPAFAVRRMAEQLLMIVTRALAVPETRLGQFDVVSPSERHWLVLELNDTATESAAGSPSEALAEQAAGHPEDLALAVGEERWTWRDLDQRVGRLARRLRAAGVGPESLVGICLERSPALVTAPLAVLRAGGAYLPLDPSSPPARLRNILADSGASVLLTRESYLGQLAPEGLEVICLDEAHDEAPGQEEPGAIPVPRSDNLAYVIYTSGSTGKPKGVMVSRAGLEQYLAWATRAYAASAEMGSVLHSPVAFDLAVTSLFVPMLSGKPLVLLPEDAGIEALGAAIGAGVDFLKLTPAQLEILGGFLLEDAAARVSALVLGGEE